jgi:hypothetical protein
VDERQSDVMDKERERNRQELIKAKMAEKYSHVPSRYLTSVQAH